ncbi:hypothetical protein DCE79_16695 [Lysinibacillus sp. 2017]|uniref:hypothetical protein n=1 Tax=unclassified Lysinibacillus TaxID=2636778 RepID=UPI000D526E46|nr:MULTISPECIES: hypothetical protein [unclassified Lysinibacillus]AWE08882.1 hypothetical protein DCE79_16695 [Lysinibacillus sp. 2017]TGN34733.1 hypothetical protein E4L99_13220 [Lysinibacillus sp. S2017]
MNEFELQAVSTSIEKAFKSLQKSGRPDIQENGKSIVKDLYVDLFNDDYVLRQAKDENHTLFLGRRGTGKSTIFMSAEKEIDSTKNLFSVYINLQTCIEELESIDTTDKLKEILQKDMMYKNFLTAIFEKMKEKCTSLFSSKRVFNELFSKIENGEYIDPEFRRKIETVKKQLEQTNKKVAVDTNLEEVISGSLLQGNGEYEKIKSDEITETFTKNEIRIFSVHNILKEFTKILKSKGKDKVYLFLDDFSELSKENQKVIVDSLIAPIISSYNDSFVIKLAGYPTRTYLGNIDSTKLPVISLDFYDAFGPLSSTYDKVESTTINYVQRTLEKRLKYYVNQDIELDDIFDTGTESLNEYLTMLFYISSGIPRALGFILNYCMLSSISKGKKIQIVDLENASLSYFNRNILPDFKNDIRYKQSFYDDEEGMITQLIQNKFADEIVETQYQTKRDIVKLYTNNKSKLKKIFIDTIESKSRATSALWVPTSHFSIRTNNDKLLKTLELYFIVTKFNEGSPKEADGSKISYFGLNYGFCMEKKIDYGRPKLRNRYDYWRQPEFDLDEFINNFFRKSKTNICEKCSYEFDDQDLIIIEKHGRCVNCGQKITLRAKDEYVSLQKELQEKWKNESLPDVCMNILRTLFNENSPMTAKQLGDVLDKHHLAITKAIEKITTDETKYISYYTNGKRYYSITEKALKKFFNQ